MSADTSKMQAAAIRELCKPLRLPTVAAQAVRLAEQAAREKQSHICFLETLLSAEVEEREQNAVARRIKEAHFPKVKTLDEFNFQEARHLPVTLILHLAEGEYIGKTEPVLFLGDGDPATFCPPCYIVENTKHSSAIFRPTETGFLHQ